MTTTSIGSTARRLPSAVLVVGAFALSTLLSITPALGAPDNANTLVLDLGCTDGQHYSITVLEPTPDQAAAHVVNGTSVLIPTVFQWHIVITDTDGNVLDESNPPPELVHGHSAAQLDTIECTFTQTAHHEAYTVQVDGTVQAYLPH